MNGSYYTNTQDLGHNCSINISVLSVFSVDLKLTVFNHLLKNGYEMIFIPPVSGGIYYPQSKFPI
jgi:molybdopterin converting factor small subunit